jgi:hypothetical protein
MYTEFQKKIIQAIQQGKIHDIESFLLEFCELEKSKNEDMNFPHGFSGGVFVHGMDIYVPRGDKTAL